MNIWLVCQYYKPEPGAPSARLSGFASVWKKSGHEVTILTAIPNHPNGIIHPDYIHKPAFLKETMDGVNVHRHWLMVTPNNGFIKKTLSHLTFAASILFNNLSHPKQRPDVIIASSPSFFAAISAWILAKRYGIPFVMEVRDLWPGIFVELGVMKKGFMFSVLEKIELFLYRRAAAVITVTRGFAKNIADRGIDPSKLFIITNGVADNELEEAQQTNEALISKLRTELQISPLTKVILYIGNHGISQALGQIIDAARILMPRNDLVFLFVGAGPDKDRLKKIARGMPNVQFIPAQPKERVWAFYKLAYTCIVPLKDVEGFSTFIPSKIFEIMAAGTAQIGCLTGEAANILQQSGAATTVPPEDPEKLAKAIVSLADNPKRVEEMGINGVEVVSKKYRHSLLAKNYLSILKKVTGA